MRISYVLISTLLLSPAYVRTEPLWHTSIEWQDAAKCRTDLKAKMQNEFASSGVTIDFPLLSDFFPNVCRETSEAFEIVVRKELTNYLTTQESSLHDIQILRSKMETLDSSESLVRRAIEDEIVKLTEDQGLIHVLSVASEISPYPLRKGTKSVYVPYFFGYRLAQWTE